jgi:hypothetical protein
MCGSARTKKHLKEIGLHEWVLQISERIWILFVPSKIGRSGTCGDYR